jgi:patatin-related protein
MTRISPQSDQMQSDSRSVARGQAASPSDVVESRPEFDLSQEVRFAVVMYGGVSLAIYINGVTQEMLRMVQSTAPGKDRDQARPLRELPGRPCDTTWTYRKLALLLGDDELRAQYRDQLEQSEAGVPPPGEDVVEQAMKSGASLRTRFVIDILSGTSAGGINAVFLAKAMANDQTLDQIKQLWVSEGDMARLLNDTESLAGLGLPEQTPPQSLLNSQRMYAKLLEALDGMDEKSAGSPAGAGTPLVDEIDLFVTVTDLQGIPQPLRLSDKLVYERRHRNVFHVKHSAAGDAAGGSNLGGDTNPFLAFAARCTSAFPFAFEPMCLKDIEEVLRSNPRYARRARAFATADHWQRFFREHTDPDTGAPIDFTTRVFADGGYLDNKPFSYATETILHRNADLMVDRKLIYIEPNPARLEAAQQNEAKPDALANVMAATLELPSYETIREDLELVLRRNRLIWRVNGMLNDIERDMDAYEESGAERHAFPTVRHGHWDQMDLADMIDEYGMSYLPYRRLRISAVTDELADIMSRLAGFDERSDHMMAIRYLIRDWRNRTYRDHQDHHGEHAGGADPRPPINEYLRDFDFRYRLRRLLFLRHKLDELQRLCAAARRSRPSTKHHEKHDPLADLRKRLDRKKLRRRLGADGELAAAGQDGDTAESELGPQDLDALAGILHAFKRDIDRVYVDMRRRSPDQWERPRSAGEADEGGPAPGSHEPLERLRELVGALGLEPRHLDYILGVPWDVASGQRGGRDHLLEFAGGDEAAFHLRIDSVFDDPAFGLRGLQERLDAVGAAMRECLRDAMAQSKQGLMEILEGKRIADAKFPPALFANVLLYLGVYYRHFEHYDQIRFPIVYETDVGEADAVEVIRISPEDATSLVDGQNAPKKLAGTVLRNFGAFLETSWRKNDIMWGRLDGAERLIVALLPAPEDERIREALLREAQIAILTEELSEHSVSELSRAMTDAILERVRSGEDLEQAFSDTIQRWRDQHTDDVQLGLLRSSGQDGDRLIEYVKANYAVNRQLEPQAMLRLMSRSAQIMGKMFESMAANYPVGGGGMRWLARLARLAWGMVEIAIPQSLVNLLFRHWIKLIYAFEVLAIVLFFALDVKDALMISGLAFGATLLLHTAVLFIGDMLRRRAGAGTVSLVVLLVFVLGLAGIGLHRIIDVGIDQTVEDMLDE